MLVANRIVTAPHTCQAENAFRPNLGKLIQAIPLTWDLDVGRLKTEVPLKARSLNPDEILRVPHRKVDYCNDKNQRDQYSERDSGRLEKPSSCRIHGCTAA